MAVITEGTLRLTVVIFRIVAATGSGESCE